MTRANPRKQPTISIEDFGRLREVYKGDRRAFFRDCLKIRSRDGDGGLLPLVLNPAQEALLRLVEKIEHFQALRSEAGGGPAEHLDLSVGVIVLKPRKEGISTLIQAFMFHRCEFHPHTNALVMAHTVGGAGNIATIGRRFAASWPRDLGDIKIPMNRTSSDMLEWFMGDQKTATPAWDSRINIASVANENTARSFDYNIVHVSEEAHFKSPDGVSAAKNSVVKRHYIFEESTANGLDQLFYPSWQKSMYFEDVFSFWQEHRRTPDGWNGKFRFFWAWWQDPNYRISVSPEEESWLRSELDDYERDLVARFDLGMDQIKWRRLTIANKCSEQRAMAPEEFFRQEYPADAEEAFISQDSSVFNTRRLDAMTAGCHSIKPEWHGSVIFTEEGKVRLVPDKRESFQEDPLVIYRRPRSGGRYVISADSATGGAESVLGDYSVAMVFDRDDGLTMTEVARYVGKPDTRAFADVIHWLHLLFNKAFVIPEANYPGNSTCQRLVELGTAPIYHRQNEDMVGSNEKDATSFYPGFKTHKNTKPLIVGLLQSSIQDNLIRVYTAEAVRQMRIFSNVGGNLKAPQGDNDDFVIAIALAAYAHFKKAPPMLFARTAPTDVAPNDKAGSMAKAVQMKIKRSRAVHRRDEVRRSAAKRAGRRLVDWL